MIKIDGLSATISLIIFLGLLYMAYRYGRKGSM